MKKSNAFSLPEIMIAMVVMGIIMALVLPTIFGSAPNQNKMMMKKAFYTTETIVSDLLNDHNLYPDMTEYCRKVTTDASGNQVVSTDLSNTNCYFGFEDSRSVAYNGETYSGASKFANLFKQKLNVSSSESIYKFTTNDGMIWDLTGTNSVWTKGVRPAVNKKTIIVDVNGKAGPNKYGKEVKNGDFDKFRIDIYSDGKMKVNSLDTDAAEYITVGSNIQE